MAKNESTEHNFEQALAELEDVVEQQQPDDAQHGQQPHIPGTSIAPQPPVRRQGHRSRNDPAAGPQSAGPF